MSEPQRRSSPVLFSDTESPAAVERLPLNRAAVGGFAIGAMSWLAILHPALWVVPAVGIVLAGAAWRSIERSESRYRGGRLALVGLTLGLFFLAYAPTRQVTRQQRLYGESERVCREWLTLVCRGQLREAHQLRLRYDLRTAGDQTLDDFYKKPEHEQDLEKFRQDAVVKQLWGTAEIVREVSSDNSAPQPVIALVANRSATTTVDGDDWIKQQFLVERTEGGVSRKMTVNMETLRLPMALTAEGIWMVREASAAPVGN